MAAKLEQSQPEPRRPSMFGARSGFLIPKNKLLIRGGAKNEAPSPAPATKEEEGNPQAQRKGSTKWGPDLTLDSTVRKARASAYQIRLEQITKELNSGALEIGGNEGSVSSAKGLNSSNMKESEHGKFVLLELEKQEIIGEILQLNPGYKAPDDYKRLLKETKVPLPTKAHSGHNIIGVLIGPESNTQKRLQEETGAKIRVYGTKKADGEKVEVLQPDINEAQDAYEDLYINVSADSYDKVDAAVALIELLLTPVSVADTSGSAIVSPAVTSDSVTPPAAQQVQSTTSQPGLLPYQSHSAHWLSTPQTNVLAIPSSGTMPSPSPNNSLQLQPPVSFSMHPYTGQPPHMNIMPRNPPPVPGPQLSMPNMQQSPPQFQANLSIGPPFSRPSGTVNPQPMLSSSSGPLPFRPLQTPHASGGWQAFSPGTVQSQRPSQAAPSFMPVRPPISVSPIAATPPLQGAVPSVPFQSNISSGYGTQHPPGANFTPSATLPSSSRLPGGPQAFGSVFPRAPSSGQVLPSPAGALSRPPYPLSTPQMRGPPSPFPQVGPTPGMAHLAPSPRLPAALGMPGLSSLASASTSYSQNSIAALRPLRPTTGDFTFRPLVSPLPGPDLPASTNPMVTHTNTHLALPQAPLFHPGNQSTMAPVQRPLDVQPRALAPTPHFPGAGPWNPVAPAQSVSPGGFRPFPPAAIPPAGPMPPSNSSSSNSLPPRPFHFLAPAPAPQQNSLVNADRQGGVNPIYNPFAPTAVSGVGAKKTADADPEYEDLMASVGLK